MGAPSVDLMLASLVVALVALTCCSATRLDLATLLRNHQQQQQQYHPEPISDDKRSSGEHLGEANDGNNPCPRAEAPFPCKSSPQCVPVSFLCDGSIDCDDGYDEDEELCTAKHRPPIEDITKFLSNEKDWILGTLFGGKPIGKVAHALVVSQNMDDFRRRLNMSSRDMKVLRTAFEAVANMDEEELEDLGMPISAWNEVSFIFGQLLRSGFDSRH